MSSLTSVPSTNGRIQELDFTAIISGQRSRLLDLLPAVFGAGHDGDFLGRYLLIFETILDQYDQLIAGLPERFDPSVAPESFLPWLASWVGLVLDDGWPVARQRAVLARSMELHRRRGTVRGLTEHIQLYTGYKPEIVEQGGSMILGPDTQLGYQTVLGRGDQAFHFSVVLRVPDPSRFERSRLRTIIEAQRPAHATYSLFLLPGPGDLAEASPDHPELDKQESDGGYRS